MAKNWVLGVAGLIAVLGVAGIGFATYTATATVNVNATAGSFYLYESGAVASSSISSASGGCGFSAPGTSITLTATNLLPGDYCNFTVTVTDPGSIGGNWGAPIPACVGPCTQLTLAAANLGTYVTLLPLSANSDQFYVLVTDHGSGQVTESDSWTFTLTGTPV